jgi:hypothetical protein
VCRGILELVEQVEQAGPYVVARLAACGWAVPREQVEMIALVLGQAQRMGQRREYLVEG